MNFKWILMLSAEGDLYSEEVWKNWIWISLAIELSIYTELLTIRAFWMLRISSKIKRAYNGDNLPFLSSHKQPQIANLFA